MFNVNADMFRAASLFQSTDQGRYYLAGVHIEPHPVQGAILAATDGHRLLVVHDEAGTCDGIHENGYIVNLDKASLAATKVGRNESPRRIVSTGLADPLWICFAPDDAGNSERIHFLKDWYVDGTFPGWRRVLPAIASPSSFGIYNPELLASFAAAGKILNDGKAPPMALKHGEKGGPALIRFQGLPHCFGVIMPMRGDGSCGLPDFMQAKPAMQTEKVLETEEA